MMADQDVLPIATIDVETPTAKPDASFCKPSGVFIPESPEAIAAFEAKKPFRLRFHMPSSDFAQTRDNQAALWVHQSPDGQAWSHLVSSTHESGTPPSVDLEWDGKAIWIRAHCAVSKACDSGIAIDVLPYQPPKVRP